MDITRWNKFTLPQKLGNVGSEVARARLCEEKKDSGGKSAALKRVLEMLDAVIPTLSTPQKKELVQMRELISSWSTGQNTWDYSPVLMEEYFTQFAYLTH